MGVISTANFEFTSADKIYSKAKRFLESFNLANLLDDGEFPTFTKEVIMDLGIGVYREAQALIEITNKQGCIPPDFRFLHEAYKCKPDFNWEDKGCRRQFQSASSFAFITQSVLVSDNQCQMDCCVYGEKDYVSVRSFVQEGDCFFFRELIPLRLSPNVSPDSCTDHCLSKCSLNKSAYEISISGDKIYTNFDKDFVYIKYYAFPMDSEGNLLVPDINDVKKTIEWYIIYQVLLSAWFNSSVPDIQNKWQEAQVQYEKALAEAKFYLKLPSFAEMVNQIRNVKSQNKYVYFTRQYSNNGFQLR